jgi:hypothetical protein
MWSNTLQKRSPDADGTRKYWTRPYLRSKIDNLPWGADPGGQRCAATVRMGVDGGEIQ